MKAPTVACDFVFVKVVRGGCLFLLFCYSATRALRSWISESLRGHLKSGHAWSPQNRPCTEAIRDEIVLLCFR